MSITNNVRYQIKVSALGGTNPVTARGQLSGKELMRVKKKNSFEGINICIVGTIIRDDIGPKKGHGLSRKKKEFGGGG